MEKTIIKQRGYSKRQFLGTAVGFFVTGAMSAFGMPKLVLAAFTGQSNWRFCNKCQAMFYNGYRGKGRCAAGESHVAQGYSFVLPHDIPGTSTAQTDWRFCNKCQAMFYNGYPNKGHCAAGGSHVAQGYNFVLPHPTYSCAHCNDGSCQCGYATGAELCASRGGEDPKIGCSKSH